MICPGKQRLQAALIFLSVAQLTAGTVAHFASHVSNAFIWTTVSLLVIEQYTVVADQLTFNLLVISKAAFKKHGRIHATLKFYTSDSQINK